jgi:mutator protein MutT
MVFPISIKGVLYGGGRVVLLENERSEWELPGGRLEPGETPEGCLAREVREELGIAVEVGPLLDCWVYEVFPNREVVIVTYGLRRRDKGDLRVSEEHRRIGLFRSTEFPCRAATTMPSAHGDIFWAQKNTAEACSKEAVFRNASEGGHGSFPHLEVAIAPHR